MTSNASSETIARARAAFLRVGVIAPLAVLGLAAIVVAVWLPQLPDPVATHWSGRGPDGFGPRWSVLILPLIGAVLVGLFAAIVLFTHRLPSGGGAAADERPRWSSTARLFGALSLGLGLLMALLTVAAAGVQRGLSDAADAAEIMPWTLAGFGVLILGSVAGWFLQPVVEAAPSRATGVSGVPIAPTERAAWFGTVSLARTGRIVLGLALVLLAVTTALTFATDAGGGWILLATLALLIVLVATCLVFRVRVDRAGLQVRSLAGWPNTRIPLTAIAKAEVVDIDPFGEFGGWGWRIGMDGRRGVVMRRGEALQVTRDDGRVFVVTVDGANEAAAVVEGLRTAAPDQKEER